MMYASGEVNMTPKDDDDQMMGRMSKGEAGANRMRQGVTRGGQIVTEVNWDVYLKKFDTVSRQDLLGALTKLLLQTPAGVGESTLEKFVNSSTREAYIKTATIQLMSTPEYQMC